MKPLHNKHSKKFFILGILFLIITAPKIMANSESKENKLKQWAKESDPLSIGGNEKLTKTDSNTTYTTEIEKRSIRVVTGDEYSANEKSLSPAKNN